MGSLGWVGRREDIPGVSSVIGSRHDLLDEKEKKKSRGKLLVKVGWVNILFCLEMWSLCFVQLG